MSKKILIITPSWIGDCVMTQPLYRRLHELHPGCTIDAFAPKWSMAVFERMPEISRVIENPFGHGALELKKRWRIGRELGKQGYDQVIVLPGSLKSALIAFATGIKQRTGYIGESRYFLLNDIRKLDKAALPLMVDRYTALAHPTQADFNGHSDNPRFTISPESRAAALAKYGLDTDKPVLAFCPGAEYGPAKRWPARHFAELGRRYLAQGWQVWLFGSQKDFDIAEEINRLSDGLFPFLAARLRDMRRIEPGNAAFVQCVMPLRQQVARMNGRILQQLYHRAALRRFGQSGNLPQHAPVGYGMGAHAD